MANMDAVFQQIFTDPRDDANNSLGNYDFVSVTVIVTISLLLSCKVIGSTLVIKNSNIFKNLWNLPFYDNI